MKATDFLKRQHRQLEKLFRDALKSEGSQERRSLLQEIAQQYKIHSTLEEETFYPAVREAANSKKGVEMVAEAYEEHHVVDLVLADLDSADLSAETYQAKVTVLRELIEHHVEEEEEEMFPMAEKKLGSEELTALGAQLKQRAEAIGAETES